MLRSCGCEGCYFSSNDDISILQELLLRCDNLPVCYIRNYECKAIKNLLKRNEYLEYKLKEKICFEGHRQFEDLKKNSVSKDRIRKKIGELSKIKGDLATHIAVTEKINVLIEILEEEDES